MSDELIFETALVGKPKYLQAIGLLSVEIAHLERALAEMLASIMGAHWLVADAIFFASNSSIARMDIIARVAPLVLASLPSELKKVEAFLKRAKAVMGKRHDVVHAYWSLAERGKHVDRMKLGGYSRKPVTLTELKTMVRDVQRLYSEIIRYNTTFQARHPKDIPSMAEYWPQQRW